MTLSQRCSVSCDRASTYQVQNPRTGCFVARGTYLFLPLLLPLLLLFLLVLLLACTYIRRRLSHIARYRHRLLLYAIEVFDPAYLYTSCAVRSPRPPARRIQPGRDEQVHRKDGVANGGLQVSPHNYKNTHSATCSYYARYAFYLQ